MITLEWALPIDARSHTFGKEVKMWKKWKQWTAMLMERLFGPPLEDAEEDLTDEEEAEHLIEEADDYGIYSDYYK